MTLNASRSAPQLFLDGYIGQRYINGERKAFEDNAQDGNVSTIILDGLGINGSTTDMELLEEPLIQTLDTGGVAALWIHTVVALILLCIFWQRHIARQPYEFAFQNAIESWLYFANIMIIFLGSLYTLFGTSNAPDWVHKDIQPIVEVFMVMILVGSCLGAAFYLAYGYWGNQQLEGLSKSFGGSAAAEDRWRQQNSTGDGPGLLVNPNSEAGAPAASQVKSGPISPFMRVAPPAAARKRRSTLSSFFGAGSSRRHSVADSSRVEGGDGSDGAGGSGSRWDAASARNSIRASLSSGSAYGNLDESRTSLSAGTGRTSLSSKSVACCSSCQEGQHASSCSSVVFSVREDGSLPEPPMLPPPRSKGWLAGFSRSLTSGFGTRRGKILPDGGRSDYDSDAGGPPGVALQDLCGGNSVDDRRFSLASGSSVASGLTANSSVAARIAAEHRGGARRRNSGPAESTASSVGVSSWLAEARGGALSIPSTVPNETTSEDAAASVLQRRARARLALLHDQKSMVEREKGVFTAHI